MGASHTGGALVIVERMTFQANYGRGDELVELFREYVEKLAPLVDEHPPMRAYTDRTGTMFTVVVDSEFADVEAYARFQKQEEATYGRPEFIAWFEKMVPLVASGERQLLNRIDL
jgi:hypothetical protein